MRIKQKATSKIICKGKTSLIGQAKRSKVVSLSADPDAGPFKG